MIENKNISLKPYNTFGIDVKARIFIAVQSESELLNALKNHQPAFILGGGSNMLLTNDIDQTVIKIEIKGLNYKLIPQTSEVLVSAMAGENWHEFVLWCLNYNFGGLENLSLIPGTVGACPIQNIGAYGTEVKDTIYQVEAIDLNNFKKVIFTNSDCQFAYRDSIFKSKFKGRYLILKVTFKLTTQQHQLNIGYGAIKNELVSIKNPSIQDVSKAVIKIRQSKLPDPNKIGNSGSFFKNPIVDLALFNKIKATNPNIPFYKITDQQIKIPAGWLIEQCGFKGKRFGDAGVHQKQALVLVNYGQASGKDLLKLAQTIQKSVKETFNIDLQIEVNIFS